MADISASFHPARRPTGWWMRSARMLKASVASDLPLALLRALFLDAHRVEPHRGVAGSLVAAVGHGDRPAFRRVREAFLHLDIGAAPFHGPRAAGEHIGAVATADGFFRLAVVGLHRHV